MARDWFVFRLDTVGGRVLLEALEEKFTRSTPEKKKEIAHVTVRLRRKLNQINNVTQGGA